MLASSLVGLGCGDPEQVEGPDPGTQAPEGALEAAQLWPLSGVSWDSGLM